MKGLPAEERPRERLLRLGAGALSTVELLAILLGEGTKGKSALQLAAEILTHFRGLEALHKASVEELTTFAGLGSAKAARIKAALQLSSQRSLALRQEKKYTSSPADIFAYVAEDFLHKEVEILLVVHLDARSRPFHKEIIGIGTLTALLLEPREVFYHVIKRRADQFILVHNHPSGDPTPSGEDIRLSKILHQMSHLMQCPMHDHLIIGGNRYISLKERGDLF